MNKLTITFDKVMKNILKGSLLCKLLANIIRGNFERSATFQSHVIITVTIKPKTNLIHYL